MEAENKQMQSAKEQKVPFNPQVLENGDTTKQLLARSRYLLYKKNITGLNHKNTEHKYYSDYILILQKLIRSNA